MNQNKLKFHLERIEKLYPNKQKLNLGEMLNCINKSRSTFKRIIDANDLYLLPKFTKVEYYRKGNIYFTYEADIYDICVFLSNERYEKNNA